MHDAVRACGVSQTNHIKLQAVHQELLHWVSEEARQKSSIFETRSKNLGMVRPMPLTDALDLFRYMIVNI